MLVEVTNLCSGLGTLPREGGLFDQDFLLVEGMYLVLIAQKIKSDEEWKRAYASLPKGGH